MTDVWEADWMNNVYSRVSRASSEATPPEILDLLAEHDDSEVRWVVAGNYSTKSKTLQKLSLDKDAGVRKRAMKTIKNHQSRQAIKAQQEQPVTLNTELGM